LGLLILIMTPKKVSNNEWAMYEILVRRGIAPGLSFAEFEKAAVQVVAAIPPEAITPLEEVIERLEITVLRNRLLN
jgi:hypothetical protein